MMPMPADIDAYQLLKTYAARTQSPTVTYGAFAQAVQRQAMGYDQTIPLYRDLALNPDSVLVPRLFKLSMDKKIALQAVGNRIDSIMLPEAVTEVVFNEYRRIEENPDIPFPDDEALRISVPPEWIQAISVESDLPALLGSGAERPVPLYRILFPDGLKSMTVLSAILNDKLLEYAAMKIRNYLRRGSNRDFIQQRMTNAFSGRERLLKDSMTTVLIRPFDAVAEMRQGMGDFLYPFWAYLTTTIRKDLASRGDPGPDDMTTMQATYLMDVFNNHYKNKVQMEQDREAAFKQLETMMHKAPYIFSIEEIVDFRDSQGRPLMGKYSHEELEQWLQARSVLSVEGSLPEFLRFSTPQGVRMIAKDTLFQYLIKALHDARTSIKGAIIRDWRAIMQKLETIPPMDDDATFRSDLDKRLTAHVPVLAAVLSTTLPTLVFQELHSSKEGASELDRCFGGGRVAGADVLLNLDRKGMLSEVKMLLPFWMTIPLIVWLVKLFAPKPKARKGQAASQQAQEEDQEPKKSSQGQSNSRSAEFAAMARTALRKMLPEGRTLDEQLGILESRWNTMLDPTAKTNLTIDINTLVRDYLRTTLRRMKPSEFTVSRIQVLAANLADRPNLLKLKNHAALEEYIRLYMVKLLKR